MDAFLQGVKGFWSLKNLGALLMLFVLATVLAYSGLTPERVAAAIPRPSEFTSG
ncbi:MAG: hypothetical protein GWM92_15750 [Gemmatimonadetes bacterium]|nr:hypothetical protein [Gemmatimonadota bacterium]NIR80186.1 hypothetical protein [Gemmatimonadota bacterium]NIT88948.1 hypothetical protein [Gemmatimonadota bacterium]NIU32743.1 hypothetical protein [Gemmatimonadota bacterium]NIU37175.1 hypothetical protein [Gemmatimonadota bacterium]